MNDPSCGARDLSGTTLSRVYRYGVALLPAVALLVVAVLIHGQAYDADRARRVADQARLASASVDMRLRRLLELASFCATSPGLIERVDLTSVAENCGRFAAQIGAWVVIVETGPTHRQILNTVTAPQVELPAYPRQDEQAPLLALEARTRETGAPGIADVFTGIIRPEPIVSAGQALTLADGRDAMVYVAISAMTLSRDLADVATPGGAILGVIDPSRRIVARSTGIERTMFAAAPDWILDRMDAGAAGTALAAPGPQVTGGTWDVGYQPLEAAPGWMAGAFQPAPGGVQFWAPLSLPSAVVLAGLVLSALVLWGITGRDRAAQRLEAARQAEADAERRNQEKSRLLASFAHDIRSPLISLMGSLELIDAGRDGTNGQVRSAREATEALLQLVDDILELSFLGSGEMTFHPSPVDLRQLVTTLADQMRRQAERKGLALHLDLSPDLPSVVEVDRLRLQQVLSNLLTNAVKYTEQGTVTLRIRVEGRVAGRVTLDLAVVDTGLGLSAREIPRILREFGRLEREAERREAGSGLGLAIVQRILHGMDAALRVDSVPGQGSSFHFRLTLPVPTQGAVPDPARPLSGVVVLYSEDEPVIRQVTERRLVNAGAQVSGATDGQDALRQLANVVPDLLLIDLQMPGLDGVGLLRRLKAMAPKRTYPVFVLTSHIAGPQAAEARAAGADAVFTKPIQVAALAAAFRARRGDIGRSLPPSGADVAGRAEPLFHPDTFQDVSAFQGPDEAAALVVKFHDAMQTDLGALGGAIEAGDLGQAAAIAHRAQGLCLVLGATRLAGLLRRVEEGANARNAAAARAGMQGMDTVLAATLAEMRFALTDSAPAGSDPTG